MIRKLILSAALSAAAVTGLAVWPASAEARPPVGHGRHDHDGRPGRFARFEVLVRHRGHWDSYRTFRDRDDAERAARRLRLQGHQVKIVRG